MTAPPASVLRPPAQTARVGEAEAELYPKFFLTGSIGLEAIKSATLLESDSGAWNLGPSVSWPIFHAGAIRRNIQVQTELQEQYLAAYENTCLLYTSDAADDLRCVNLGGRRSIKKKKNTPVMWSLTAPTPTDLHDRLDVPHHTLYQHDLV